MIDLRSDTVTRPDDRMREAAADAEVGDDVYGEDPTVNDLEARAADLVGTEAALFVPTGTMGNQVAARVHADPGQQAIVEAKAHVFQREGGGLAVHSRLQTRPIDGGDRGIFTPEQVREAHVDGTASQPGTGLVVVENTHNTRGGLAIAPERIEAVADAAHELGVPVHLDGARLFNAAVALDADPADLVAPADSVMFCLSKGLGAPVGSVLAGPEAFVEQARHYRKRFGGGMRQAGVIAGPGLVALENVDRLAEDHENAALLADGLASVDGVTVRDPETNVVVADVSGTGLDADGFLERCREAGVLGVPIDDAVVRFCTHLDADRADVEAAVEAVREAMA